MHEFLSEERQLALELAQREEEDRLYRTFLDERRNREAEVAAMEDETEREELFAQVCRLTNPISWLQRRSITPAVHHYILQTTILFTPRVFYFGKNALSL